MRWIDTLPDVSGFRLEDRPRLAANALTMALGGCWDTASWERIAAAHIVAWRKSLPDQGVRVCDYGGMFSGDWALWTVLSMVTYAARDASRDDLPLDPGPLRHAEALLRTLAHRREARDE